MTRRLFALLPATLLLADSAEDAWDLVAAMAAALAEDNADGFLKRIDSEAPGFDDLSSSIPALLQQTDVRSIITPIGNEGSEAERTLQLDWELRLKPKNDDVRMKVREQAITIHMRRHKKSWMVTKIDPISFFAPPDLH
jgi:hypothetical protein